MKLKTKIYIATFLSLVVIFSSLGIVIFQTQKHALAREVDERMKSHLDDFITILSDHVSLKQSAVNISLNLADNIFQNSGQLVETNAKMIVTGTDQLTKKEKKYEISTWEISGRPLYNNFDRGQ
jgi:uncharacterized membrane protein